MEMISKLTKDGQMKKWFILFFVLTAMKAHASNSKILDLNHQIKKANGQWIARETEVSHLTGAALKRLLGSNDMPEGNGLFEDRNTLSTDAIDWRNINGTNWLGPVMNQGNCGSCVAFAAVATLEAQYRISSGLSWLNPSFSPQQLFSCGGGACDFGWTPGSAASNLKNKGIVDSACSPYESGSTGNDVLCHNIKCDNQKERTYKIHNYSSPSFAGGTATRVKEALKKGPLITTMRVFEDFLSYGGGIYKNVSRKAVGGHAISLVGFNDQERYWIIRNSWGADWGEQGFARISYDDASGIADSTWSLDMNPESNYIEVQNPKNHDYISGETSIQIGSLKPVTSNIVISGEGDQLSMVMCQDLSATNCKANLDTTKLRDGRYEILAKTDSDKSQVKEFFVLNHEPKVELNFSSADSNIDLKNPLVGRIEFNIDVKSEPILPAVLRFIIIDMNGKLIAQRSTDTVLNQMKLGFRFNTIPNGQYKIYYQAETPFQGKTVVTKSNIETITTKN